MSPNGTIWHLKKAQREFYTVASFLPPLAESTDAWEIQRMYLRTAVMIAEARLALQLFEDENWEQFKECFGKQRPPHPW